MALRVDTGTLWRTVKEPKVKRSSSTDDISSDARSTHERVGDSSTRVNGEGCSQQEAMTSSRGVKLEMNCLSVLCSTWY